MTWGLARYAAIRVRSAIASLGTARTEQRAGTPTPAQTTDPRSSASGLDISTVIERRAMVQGNRNREAAERYRAVHEILSRGC